MGTRFRFLLLPVLLYKKSYIQIGQTTASSPNRLKCYRFFFKSNFAMKDDYVEINGIPTRILTFGKWIDEPFKKNDELILCITGNPGIPGFYITFATALYNQLNKKIPIWIIGHAGHDEPPDERAKLIPPMKGNEDTFCLQGQLKHKVEFIEKYIPPDVKVHMVGHSVGAWTIIQLLKMPDIEQRVHHCYMLFPTIERMKESMAGKVWTEKYGTFKWHVLLRVFHFLSILPYSMRASVVGYYIRKWNLPESYLEDALKTLRISSLERMMEMGWDQISNVYDLDVEVIEKNKKRMTFYYGTRDHWVPVKYYEELRERIQGVDANLDELNMAHAFNIRQGPDMAMIMSNWIANRRPKLLEASQPLITENYIKEIDAIEVKLNEY